MPLFRIAHLTDVHIPPLPGLGWRDLMGKRLLGLRSWHRKWKQEHRTEILHALQQALNESAPDHLCITGDLTFTTHPAEIEQAARWLEALAPADRISLVPGNHDAYVPGALEQALQAWARWMRDDEGKGGFPYLHRRGLVDIIGLNTAIPLRLPITVGRLGADQIERIRVLLQQTESEGRPRVLLLHHPPQDGVARRGKQLLDRAALREMLAEQRIELVLHGHLHKPLEAVLASRAGPIRVLGSGSASALGARYHPAHFRLIEFDSTGPAVEYQWQYNKQSERFEPGRVRQLNREGD